MAKKKIFPPFSSVNFNLILVHNKRAFALCINPINNRDVFNSLIFGKETIVNATELTMSQNYVSSCTHDYVV